MSELELPERVVENPTYGENEGIGHQNTYDGAEQYSRTGPDYEPIERDPNTDQENYCNTSLEEAAVHHIEYASDLD